MTLQEYLGNWTRVLDANEFSRVMGWLDRLYNTKLVCPAKEDVFKAFNLCPLEDLKVVFIGMDPYPQRGVATGILFGNRSEVQEEDLSPSLKIVKEACINYEIPHNSVIFDQTLESLAKQGILMINSALTVEMNRIGSHTMLWRPLISKLLTKLSEVNNGIIYVLFGTQAQTFAPYINSQLNTVIKVPHPAYHARTGTRMDSKIFTDLNKLLKDKYDATIQWYHEY